MAPEELTHEHVKHLHDLHHKVEGLSTAVTKLQDQVNKHEQVIQSMERTQRDVHEMVALFNSMRGGVVVLGWIGTCAKWVWPLIAGAIAVSIYLKTGKWEFK